MKLLVLGYAPDHVENCRGCNVAHYSSDADICVFDSIEAVSVFIADRIHNRMDQPHSHLIFRRWEDLISGYGVEFKPSEYVMTAKHRRHGPDALPSERSAPGEPGEIRMPGSVQYGTDEETAASEKEVEENNRIESEIIRLTNEKLEALFDKFLAEQEKKKIAEEEKRKQDRLAAYKREFGDI